MRLRPFIFPLLLSAAHGVRSSKDTTEDTDYVYADRIEVSCLSRSMYVNCCSILLLMFRILT